MVNKEVHFLCSRENLSYNWYTRILRRCLTVVMSLLMILISLITIFCSKYFAETTSGDTNTPILRFVFQP